MRRLATEGVSYVNWLGCSFEAADRMLMRRGDLMRWA